MRVLSVSVLLIGVIASVSVLAARPDRVVSPVPRTESPIVLPPSYEVCTPQILQHNALSRLRHVHKHAVAKVCYLEPVVQTLRSLIVLLLS
jgi:hypothetical protein